MANGARATAFVTGAAGFIGTELVKVLTVRGHRVLGLTRFREGAECVVRVRLPSWAICSSRVRLPDVAVTFARRTNHRLSVWRVPTVVGPLAVGLIHHNHRQANAVFSNIRLRGIGLSLPASHARAGTAGSPRSAT